MERHNFHFTSYDTITVAQKACFIAGGKYCSTPPKELSHQPLRIQQEDSHFISTCTHRHYSFRHTLVFAHTKNSLCANNTEMKCFVFVQVNKMFGSSNLECLNDGWRSRSSNADTIASEQKCFLFLDIREGSAAAPTDKMARWFQTSGEMHESRLVTQEAATPAYLRVICKRLRIYYSCWCKCDEAKSHLQQHQTGFWNVNTPLLRTFKVSR